MEGLVFQNARVLTENGVLSGGCAASDGIIAGVWQGEIPSRFAAMPVYDAQGCWLSPGLIDGHVHGGGGADFMDGTAEDIRTAAQAHLRCGTTMIAPTALTCADDALFAFFDNVRTAMRDKEDMPRFLGVHLEGPYFSPAQAGAQPPQYLRQPERDHWQRILEAGGDLIVRWSAAPELPGALELGDALKDCGILASIGHTDADYACVKEAMAHGYTHLTHFYSSMAGLKRVGGFRVLGTIEAGYLEDGLTIEIIADGMHLPPELLRLILKCKAHESISLVTDAMRGAGMPDGPSILGSKADGVACVIEDGIAKMPDRTGFAGSVATADRLLRTMVEKAGLSVPEAVRMMSLNPARLYGVAGKAGSIQAGKFADFVVFDEKLTVRDVFVGGRRIRR